MWMAATLAASYRRSSVNSVGASAPDLENVALDFGQTEVPLQVQ
jgi:hypothetical protein